MCILIYNQNKIFVILKNNNFDKIPELTIYN